MSGCDPSDLLDPSHSFCSDFDYDRFQLPVLQLVPQYILCSFVQQQVSLFLPSQRLPFLLRLFLQVVVLEQISLDQVSSLYLLMLCPEERMHFFCYHLASQAWRRWNFCYLLVFCDHALQNPASQAWPHWCFCHLREIFCDQKSLRFLDPGLDKEQDLYAKQAIHFVIQNYLHLQAYYCLLQDLVRILNYYPLS